MIGVSKRVIPLPLFPQINAATALTPRPTRGTWQHPVRRRIRGTCGVGGYPFPINNPSGLACCPPVGAYTTQVPTVCLSGQGDAPRRWGVEVGSPEGVRKGNQVTLCAYVHH
jgi:hypothetical protein